MMKVILRNKITLSYFRNNLVKYLNKVKGIIFDKNCTSQGKVLQELSVYFSLINRAKYNLENCNYDYMIVASIDNDINKNDGMEVFYQLLV